MLLENHWYIAAPLHKLTRPQAVSIYDHRIVVFQDRDGNLGALRDLCPHRNVQLSLGRVSAKGLECCYHGWTFGTNGNCTYIPSLAEGGKIPAKSCVQSYPVVGKDGYAWVFIGDQPPQTEPFSMPHYQERGWKCNRFDVAIDNSVDNIVENFIDCPHTGYIHGGLFRTPASHEAKNEISVTPNGVYIDIEEDASKRESFFSRLLVGKNTQVAHVDSFILPSIVQVSYSFGDWHIIGVQACRPISPFRTRVYVHVAWKLGWLTPLAWPIVAVAGRFIIRQDIAILENQGRQLQKYGKDFCSVPADTANNMIGQLREQAAKGQEIERVRKKEVKFRL